jgi:chromosome segregation ATPase
MKNKDIEDIVLKALEEHASKQSEWNNEIDSITKEAFAAHRVKDFTDIQIRNLGIALKNKEKEISQHQNAIKNLRGYMGFLESQIEQFKFRLDEHESSY